MMAARLGCRPLDESIFNKCDPLLHDFPVISPVGLPGPTSVGAAAHRRCVVAQMDASIDVGHVGRGARSAVRAAPSRVLAIAIVGGLRDSRAHLNADRLNLVPFTF